MAAEQNIEVIAESKGKYHIVKLVPVTFTWCVGHGQKYFRTLPESDSAFQNFWGMALREWVWKSMLLTGGFPKIWNEDRRGSSSIWGFVF